MLARAKERQNAGRATVFFLDEIHRFNKAQQDVLLPAVEEGLVTLIGATTENPYFEVNAALLSRCAVVELEPLSDEEVARVVGRGAAELGIDVPNDVVEAIVAKNRSGEEGIVRLAFLKDEMRFESIAYQHFDDEAGVVGGPEAAGAVGGVLADEPGLHRRHPLGQVDVIQPEGELVKSRDKILAIKREIKECTRKLDPAERVLGAREVREVSGLLCLSLGI